jgi:hypothetical protein
MRAVIFIGYAIETLRAEAPLHAASTPAAEAVLAAVPGARESGSPHIFACHGSCTGYPFGA